MNNDEEGSLVYKTPSMEIIDKINNSTKNKIILTGVKKSGKTTTLKCLIDRSSDSKDIIIYIDYSNLDYEASLSKKEYEYYYELLLAKKIIEFIKINYSNYYKDLMFDDKYIQTEFNKFRDYLYLRVYASQDISYQKKMFISKINEILKQIVGINSITLLIDHFDFVGSSSKRFQMFMNEYFDMFDKVVITSNDEDVTHKNLEEKGYEIIEVEYGKNIDNVKKILTSHFQYWFNQINYNSSNPTILTRVNRLINNNEFCYLLIEKTNGNIDMMINIIKIYFIQDCTIEAAITSVLSNEKELNMLTFRRILHL